MEEYFEDSCKLGCADTKLDGIESVACDGGEILECWVQGWRRVVMNSDIELRTTAGKQHRVLREYISEGAIYFFIVLSETCIDTAQILEMESDGCSFLPFGMKQLHLQPIMTRLSQTPRPLSSFPLTLPLATPHMTSNSSRQHSSEARMPARYCPWKLRTPAAVVACSLPTPGFGRLTVHALHIPQREVT